jgi:hypothetical protein
MADNHNVNINNPIELRGWDGTAIPLVIKEAIAITESDTATFKPGILYVGTGGNITVKLSNGSDWVVFKNIPDGVFFPAFIKAVHTDTTALDLVICY